MSCCLRDLTAELFAPARRLPAAGELVDHHEADVVTGVLVLATGIAETNDEPHRASLRVVLRRSPRSLGHGRSPLLRRSGRAPHPPELRRSLSCLPWPERAFSPPAAAGAAAPPAGAAAPPAGAAAAPSAGTAPSAAAAGATSFSAFGAVTAHTVEPRRPAADALAELEVADVDRVAHAERWSRRPRAWPGSCPACTRSARMRMTWCRCRRLTPSALPVSTIGTVGVHRLGQVDAEEVDVGELAAERVHLVVAHHRRQRRVTVGSAGDGQRRGRCWSS